MQGDPISLQIAKEVVLLLSKAMQKDNIKPTWANVHIEFAKAAALTAIADALTHNREGQD